MRPALAVLVLALLACSSPTEPHEPCVSAINFHFPPGETEWVTAAGTCDKVDEQHYADGSFRTFYECECP